MGEGYGVLADKPYWKTPIGGVVGGWCLGGEDNTVEGRIPIDSIVVGSGDLPVVSLHEIVFSTTIHAVKLLSSGIQRRRKRC